MSDALKRMLDEVDAAWHAANDAGRDAHAHDTSPDPLIGCRGCAAFDLAQHRYLEAAARFVPAASRLLRIVADAECENKRRNDWTNTCRDNLACDELWCLRCRIAREAERGTR